ncbi:pilus assembly protein N-terminal domain-containing protein [Tepidamorphus sp. 3E244]|uniref:pilus assembly protein N-terminal domain-containing protein n=1 Tax=Tepidamorphus sp. 3E244 TaxID=3385498 RepID=UPI0038FCC83D
MRPRNPIPHTGMLARAAVVACAALLLATQARAERLVVGVDRAMLVRVDVPVDTIVIGNPVIADASVYDQTTLIITGKAFGETNLIVLDSLGKIVHEADVAVSTPRNTVTMHKGAARLTYTCAPACERTLRAGDAVDEFTNLQGQVSTTLDMGKGQASQ